MRFFYTLRYKTLMWGVLLVNLVHPLIHGTPIDGGALDSLIALLNNELMTRTPVYADEEQSAVPTP